MDRQSTLLISELQQQINQQQTDLIDGTLEKLKQNQNGQIKIIGVSFNRPLELKLGTASTIQFESCTFSNTCLASGDCDNLSFHKCSFSQEFTLKDLTVRQNIYFKQADAMLDKLSIIGTKEKQQIGNIEYSIIREQNKIINIFMSNVNFTGNIKNSFTPVSKLEMVACDFHTNFSQYFSFPQSMEWSANNCTFYENFNNAGEREITKPFIFTACVFEKGITFRGLKFNQGLTLKQCTVRSEGLHFHNCTINKLLKLDGKFSNITFAGGKLAGIISLVGAPEFETESIKFSSVTFVDAFLSLSEFNVDAIYIVRDQSDLSALHFYKLYIKTQLYMKVSVEGSFLTEKTKFNRSDFVNCNFSGPTHFKKSTFKIAPQFDHCEFFFDTSFKTSTFIDKSAASEGFYRQLKHKMGKINNYVEESRFAAYEIQARIKSFGVKDFFEWFLSCLYFIVNRCGEAIFQPFLVLLVMSGVFFYIFARRKCPQIHGIHPLP